MENPELLRRVLGGLEFDVVVNCAAWTHVDACEGHSREAFQINAEAPSRIAQYCSERRARLVHVSTDYVFDGLLQRPYHEEDAPAPVSVYGASKKAGEDGVLAAGERHWVVRVSWLFGPDRASFVDQIIDRALTQDRVGAVADKWASPTYTVDAAALLRPFLRTVPGGGLLHLSNAGYASWQEYGQWVLDCAAEAGLPLRSRTVESLGLRDMQGFVAKRPPFTPLDTSRLAALGGVAPRSWREAVSAYVRDRVAAGCWKTSF